MRQPPLNKQHTKTRVPENFALVVVLWLVVTLFMASLPHFALAKWDGEPDENAGWYQSLFNNQLGVSCCGVGDAVPIGDSDWRVSSDGSGYEVFLNSVWTRVPDEAVLNHTTNPTGHAVLFVLGSGKIVCFVRPTES